MGVPGGVAARRRPECSHAAFFGAVPGNPARPTDSQRLAALPARRQEVDERLLAGHDGHRRRRSMIAFVAIATMTRFRSPERSCISSASVQLGVARTPA